MLQVVEFLQDKGTRQAFAPELRTWKRVFAELRSRGVLVYPGTGTADGTAGDHILIAPPFIIESSQMSWVAEQIGDAAARIRGAPSAVSSE